MEPSSRRQLRLILWIAIGAALLAAGLFLLSVRSVETIPITLTVGPVAGFQLGTAELAFGTVPPGGQGMRNIEIPNSGDRAALVRLRAEGGTAPWMGIDRPLLVIRPRERRKVSVYVTVPGNVPAGNYSGEIGIVTHRLR